MILPLILLVIYPLAKLLLISVHSDRGAFGVYAQVLTEPQFAGAVYNTMQVSLFSTVLAVALGAAAAFITERTDIPGRQIWRLLFLLPILLPSYVMSLAWEHWIGPVGLLTQWLRAAWGGTPWTLTGLHGITAVMAVAHLPITYLLVRSALHSIPARLEQAARVAGAGPGKVLSAVTLPLLAPALVSSGLLSFASAIDNFGIPAFIGIPSGITVLSTLIYQKVIGLGASQYEQAAALSVITGICAALPVYLQGALFRGPKYRREESGGRPDVYPMGRWKYILVILLGVWQVFTVIGPAAAMFVTSLAPAYGVKVTVHNATLAHYFALWSEMPAVAQGVVNSLSLATVATVLVLFFAWPLARAVAFTPSRLVKILDAVSTIPYCLPGMVVALAVLLTWIRPIPGSSFSLYGGMGILLLAYVPRFYTFGVRAWVTAWARFSPTLEEAGRVAGAGPLMVTGRIILPNFRAEGVGGGLLIFLLAFTELTLSALLASSQFTTIGVVIFHLESAGQALESAALGTILTVCTVAFSLLVSRYLLGGNIRRREVQPIEECSGISRGSLGR